MVISQKMITLIARKPPQWEKKNKKREIKYLGINVPKVVKDLYLEKIRPWSKNVKIIQTEGKVYLVYGLEEFILLK